MSDQLRDDLAEHGIQLKTCHEYPNADVPYSRRKIHDFIESVDVVILPARVKTQGAKGANRLALAWHMVKPCVISPLDSYMQHAIDGEDVLVANSPKEFIEKLVLLRDDPELRKILAANGKRKAIARFDPRISLQKLVDKLQEQGLYLGSQFLQVIIPHYSDKLVYLDQAVKTVLSSEGPPRDVLVVSSSKVNPAEILPEGVRLHHQAERLSFSQANNLGVKIAHPDTTHFLFLNDDTIVGKTALKDMFQVMMRDENLILNPYSNCDKGWLHNDKLVVETPYIDEHSAQQQIDLHPNMTIDQVRDVTEEIRKFRADTEKDFYARHDVPFCAMYATLMPKSVVDRVGLLNTDYSNGGEDADFCYRAHRLGIKTAFTKAAWIFHFGGKTRKVSQEEDPHRHKVEDELNNKLLHLRWGRGEKKKIGIWLGPAWEFWDLNSYKTTGIGGSETCAGRLAETAVENGCSVIMFGAHEKQSQNGVELVPWQEFKPEEHYFDLFIASRNLSPVVPELKAKKILVWVHDVFIMGTKEVSEFHRNRVDKFICLSPWHKQFVMDYHSLPAEKIDIIPNGVNVELFD